MTSESATSPAIRPPQVEQPPPHEIPVISELISAAPPSPAPQITMMDIVNSNGILTDQLVDEEPSFTSNFAFMNFENFHYLYLDSDEYAEKYRRYEADFRKYLMDKHFSEVDEYEETTTIDGETICSSVWPCARWYADPDASFLDPPQCIEEEEDEVEEMEEVEEVEEEVEEVGEVEEVEEEQEEVIDSASAEIPNGEIPNGGTVLEDTCDVGKKPDMPI
ncbi:uncharacterized protein LOC9319676 [Arabidopsis lyrata subsp. lyrata]|uniref:uncharacterized protein LOC9319676 n=1 Tax=Arabidopsis lyrata subsp. lyrata TaxID=81972 RepID=UPI000A29BDB8|nr:uncharacterized protein LOC9319676 [Arabidopsis lyrata subsp. lyrata]|eukprot:XP_020889025.1 uncharacterized protein LOC9319676 [Arabidopsis lyrata subsp. lyrata]